MLELFLIAFFFLLFICLVWWVVYSNDFDLGSTILGVVFTVILIVVLICILAGGEAGGDSVNIVDNVENVDFY